MKFVIFHGTFGTPQGNWFPKLKKDLEKLNQTVIAIQFPVKDWDTFTKEGPQIKPKHQNLANWLKTFEEEVLPEIKKDERLCFIGHSLAPVFILHLLEKYNIKLRLAIFVSPFLENLNDIWQYDLINKGFFKTDFDFQKLKNLIARSYVVYGDDDPYVNIKYTNDFLDKMGSKKIVVKGGGHLNAEFGYADFPLVLDLCKKEFV